MTLRPGRIRIGPGVALSVSSCLMEGVTRMPHGTWGRDRQWKRSSLRFGPIRTWSLVSIPSFAGVHGGTSPQRVVGTLSWRIYMLIRTLSIREDSIAYREWSPCSMSPPMGWAGCRWSLRPIMTTLNKNWRNDIPLPNIHIVIGWNYVTTIPISARENSLNARQEICCFLIPGLSTVGRFKTPPKHSNRSISKDWSVWRWQWPWYPRYTHRKRFGRRDWMRFRRGLAWHIGRRSLIRVLLEQWPRIYRGIR